MKEFIGKLNPKATVKEKTEKKTVPEKIKKKPSVQYIQFHEAVKDNTRVDMKVTDKVLRDLQVRPKSLYPNPQKANSDIGKPCWVSFNKRGVWTMLMLGIAPSCK